MSATPTTSTAGSFTGLHHLLHNSHPQFSSLPNKLKRTKCSKYGRPIRTGHRRLKTSNKVRWRRGLYFTLDFLPYPVRCVLVRRRTLVQAVNHMNTCLLLPRCPTPALNTSMPRGGGSISPPLPVLTSPQVTNCAIVATSSLSACSQLIQTTTTD